MQIVLVRQLVGLNVCICNWTFPRTETSRGKVNVVATCSSVCF